MRVLSTKQDSHNLAVLCGGVHAAVCKREATKVVCRREKIWSLETAFEKAFYGMGAYSRKAVSWMEHQDRRRGIHIDH